MWKKNIEEKYNSFSKEQLFAFGFYLQYGNKMQKDLYNEYIKIVEDLLLEK